MSETDRMAKGHVMMGYTKYIKKKWGQDGVIQCQKDIGENITYFKDAKWYPEETNSKLLHWIADTYGKEYVERAAAFTVTQSGIIAFAAKIIGIEKVLERGVEDYYRSFNYGDIKIEVQSNEAIIRLIDSPVDELDCYSWTGALRGILELVGKTGTVEQVECAFRDGKDCVFKMKWN